MTWLGRELILGRGRWTEVNQLIGPVPPFRAAGAAPLSRRQLLAGVGVGLGGSLLLSACGSLSSSTSSKGGSSQSAGTSGLAELPGGTPKRGGTFTVGVLSGGQEENLFPGTSVGTPDFVRDYNLYNLLFYLGKNVTPLVPGLALSAEPNSDASVWTFNLRDGVTWHDGKPFTADDVVYNFQAVWSNASLNYSAGFLTGLVDFKNVRKLDSLTVQVPLTTPAAQFPTIFAYFDFPVVQEGATAKTAAVNPVGTGPFKFSSFTPGSRSVFTANKDYWETGKPYVDQLVVDSSFTDTNSLFNALLQGTVNLFPSIPLVTAREQLSSRQVQILASPFAAQSYMFAMRVDKGPFADNRVRTAFKLLVDRQAMIDGAWAGFGSVAYDLLAPGTEYYAGDLKRDQDVDQAKSLFKAAGVLGDTFTLPTCDFLPGMVESSTILAQQASAAGIKVSGEHRERGHLLHSGRRVPGPAVRLRGRPAGRLAALCLPLRVHHRLPVPGHALGIPAGRGAGGEPYLPGDREPPTRARPPSCGGNASCSSSTRAATWCGGTSRTSTPRRRACGGCPPGPGSATTTGGCVMAGSPDRPAGRFAGLPVVVLGGAGVLGAAAARAFAREGAKVAVGYRSSAGAAAALVAELQEAGAVAMCGEADVTDLASLQAFIADAAARLSGVDILVNAFGRIDAADAVRFAATDPAAWDELFRVDVRGTFLACQVALPYLQQAAQPAIVNFAGSYGNGTNQENLVNSVSVSFCAAKGAIRGFTAALARDLAPHIRVNAISPRHDRGELGRRLEHPRRASRRGGGGHAVAAPGYPGRDRRERPVPGLAGWRLHDRTDPSGRWRLADARLGGSR